MPAMSNSPRTIRRDTRVFISAVTRELGSVRTLVKKALEDNDYHAVEQDNFPPDYRDLKAKLRERINSCDAVVHIAGHCYGAEPPERPADAPRRSYTQLEYDMAVERGKPVYVFLTGAEFPADPHDAEAPELQELQAAHRRRLISTGQDHNPTVSILELDQKVRSLQFKVERLTGEIQQVDEKMDVHGGRLRRWLVAIAVVVLAVLGTLGYVAWREEASREQVGTNFTSVSTRLEDLRKQFADPDVLSGKIKSHIRRRADEEIAAARAKAPDDWRKRDEIEKRRDQAQERVQDLVETIRKGLAGEPDSIFVEAAEVLDKRGVDEAIRYLEQKQPTIDKKISAAKSFRDEAEGRLREAYRPKVLQAKLYETSLKWDRSLKIREEVASENPRWFEARADLGGLLRKLARYSQSEVHLRAAVKLAVRPGDEATGLNSLAELLQETNRLLEAEPLYRRSLAIDEKSYGPDHPDVARDLNNLAGLLQAANRLAKAEPLYRRSLAIDEKSYGPDHPDVAGDLNNLAVLLKITNRLSEAEPLYRRSLAIAEKSNGPDHPDVAICVNNLAVLLQVTNRLSEAEPLYRRSLAISEKSYGPDHSDVAIPLNNLARLLLATNRLAEAEPLFRRALAIVEESYGPEHSDVATPLNNLARLLLATNRLAEAEPLFHRVVRVFSRFQRSTGHEHPLQHNAVGNYRRLLTELKLAEPEIAGRIKAASEATDKLSPIVPEMERLLGPAKPVADVLTSLDRKYEEQGKPAVYSLKPNEHIAPHLDEVLRPSAEGLNAEAQFAILRPAPADAMVLSESALKLMGDQPAQFPARLAARMNRAAARGELGLVKEARDELVRLLREIEQATALDASTKGRAHYHLALCQWRLGDRTAAQRSAEESLGAHNSAPKANPVDPGLRMQSEELLAAVKAGKAPPPLAKVDVSAALEAARARYRAREALAKLPLNEKAGPLLDQVLEPARSTQEVFDTLERSYREQGKPAVWFLPLKDPIDPHLNQLLGPAKPVKEVLESLDRQYRAQRKSAVWFLSLNEPIAPHLDELLGKSAKSVTH
jgi:tetratricopeptide (TPR) repeat protein